MVGLQIAAYCQSVRCELKPEVVLATIIYLCALAHLYLSV